MRIYGLQITLLLVWAAFFVGCAADKQADTPSFRVSSFSDRVEIRDSNDAIQPVNKFTRVGEGFRLSTTAGGRLSLEISRFLQILELPPSSNVRIEKIGRNRQANSVILNLTMTLSSGAVRVQNDGRKQVNFHVKAPALETQLSVNESANFKVKSNGNVLCRNGQIGISLGGQRFVLNSGQILDAAVATPAIRSLTPREFGELISESDSVF